MQVENMWSKTDKLYQEAVILYLHTEVSHNAKFHELAVANSLIAIATRITDDVACFVGAIDVLSENGREKWNNSGEDIREIVIHFLLVKSRIFSDCAEESEDYFLEKGAKCRENISKAFRAAAEELGYGSANH